MRKERIDDDDRLFGMALDEGVPFAVVSLKLGANEIGVVRGKDGPFFIRKKGCSRVFKTDHDGPAGWIGRFSMRDIFDDARQCFYPSSCFVGQIVRVGSKGTE